MIMQLLFAVMQFWNPNRVHCSVAFGYRSPKKEEEGPHYSTEQMDHEEAENGEEVNSPIEQVALTVPTTDDPSLPVFTFRVWVLGLLSCITLSFLNQFFSYRREPLTITAVSAQIAVLPIGRFMAAALPKRTYWLPWTRFQFCLNPGPFNLKEHVLITIFAGAGATTVTAIHIVNIVKIYYRRNLDLPVGLLIVITSQVIMLD
jgi:OPT family oligopeptide transporter